MQLGKFPLSYFVFKTTKYVNWHWPVANDGGPGQKTVSLCFSYQGHKPAALDSIIFHIALGLFSISPCVFPVYQKLQ